MYRSVFVKAFLSCSTLCALAWAQVPPPNVAPGSPLPAPAEGGDEKKPEAEPPPAAAPTPAAPAPVPASAVTEAPAVAPASPQPSAAPASQPVVPPVQPAFPPGAMDAGPAEKPAQPPETTLALELDVGLIARLGGSSDYDLERDQSSGMLIGPSLWFAPSRLWSLGLAYEHAGLGVDRSRAAVNTVDTHRSLDAVWLRGRAYPWRSDSFGVFVGLGLGVSWQHVSGSGVQAADDFVRPSAPYSCSASEGPGFALGGGLGLDVDLTRSLAFMTGFDAAAHRQSGETIEGCAPGSGSITSLGARLGFAYRFDLDESSAPPARVGHAR